MDEIQDEISRLFLLEAQLRRPSAQDVTVPSGLVDSKMSCFQYMCRSQVAPDGSGVTLSLPQNSTAGELKIRAQMFFRQFLRLVMQNGRAPTDPMEALQTAGVEEGEQLTVVASPKWQQQAQLSLCGVVEATGL